MKRKIRYLTALWIAIAATTLAQSNRGGNTIRPSAPQVIDRQTPQTQLSRSRQSSNPSYVNTDEYYDGVYYQAYIATRPLTVRSAPANGSSALMAVPEGQILYLADNNSYSAWRTTRITYFDAEAWEYKTTTGYVESQSVRPANTMADNRTGRTSTSRPISGTRIIPEQPASVATGSGRIGRVSIWTDCDDDGHIDVYVDGNPVGQLTTCFYTSAPACGEKGTLTLDLSIGKHNLSAFGATKIWRGEVVASADECTMKQLSAR